MVIPADWKEQELSRVAEIGPGINKALSEMGTGSLYVTVEDIYHGSFLDAGRLGRIRISKSEVERFSLQVGDLVLGKSSVKRDGIGYPNLFLGCSEPVVPSGFTYRVRPDKKVLSSPFLLQYLRSRPGRKWIIDNSQSSALTNINSSIINRYPVIIPPLKEQEAIAEALSDTDAAIESLDALIVKKRDVKQATMQQLLTGRTRLPGFTTDWKEVRLGEHATFFKGNGLPKSQLIDDGSQRCVHYGELFTHYGPVIETVTSKCVAFEGCFMSLAGDVLMPGSDVTPRGLATASAIKVSDVVLGGDVIVIRTKPTSLFGPFLSNFIRMSKGRVLRLVKGSTVYHIHAKDLADLEVLMPPLKEQEAIAEAFNVMDDELEALTEQVSKLRMVKEGMMQDLLTGKVRLV